MSNSIHFGGQAIDMIVMDDVVDAGRFTELGCYWLHGANEMNQVDKVLGFKAPKWVDEIVLRRGIDRQNDPLRDVEKALRAEADSAQSRLRVFVLENAMMAERLGQSVMAEDLRAMVRLLEKRADFRAFYKNVSHPMP